ncbi:MAG: NAD-glutamate dehydrogenase [Deltaproteobacteria bacterium]|nr:NAD-glutamate dehydrogenase [Deltaproteobacteria bacterium]
MSRPAAVETDRLARIVSRVRERHAGWEDEAIAVLATALFSKDGEPWAEELGDEAAAAVATRSFAFLAAPGQAPRVRTRADDVATVLETVATDRPFIVDTIRNCVRAAGIEVRHVLHPLLTTRREPAAGGELGRLQGLDAAGESGRRESLVLAVLPPLDAERRADLEASVAARLADLVLVTDDYPALVAATEGVVAHLDGYKGGSAAWDDEVQEVQELLRWLIAGGFVFLGYRSVSLEERDDVPTLALDPDSGLGLLRRTERSHYAEPTPVASIPEPIRSRVVGGPLLVLARTTAHAPVHRDVRMEYVGVKKLDRQGRVRGEFRLLGLFTFQAHADEASEIPVLRRRLQQVLQAERVVPDSHEHREILAVFDTLPKADLFAMSVDAIRGEIRAILAAERTRELSLTLRPDPLERGVAATIVMPRDAFSEVVRDRVRDLLATRFGGEVVEDHVVLGEGEHARLHVSLAASRAQVLAIRREDLQCEIAELTRGWNDRLRDRLRSARGDVDGAALADRYAAIFPDAYKAATDPATAADDVAELEALAGGGRTRIALADAAGHPEPYTALKLYLREPLVLSDVMPVLEDLGLRVFAENTVLLPALDGAPAHVETFLVRTEAGDRVDVARDAARLVATVLAVREGRVESDGLHRLVPAAGLAWQEVQVLRAYAAYAAQIGAAPSPRASVEALIRNPSHAALLFAWFGARHDPHADRGRASAAYEAFVRALDDVPSIADDRVLRALGNMVGATVRTSYYAGLAAGRGDTVAFKIDGTRVDHMPKPRPLYEIFVHGPRIEGVHLRAGRIARGGLRWSDRRDDFRTEVLGLMKTQTVKNAVIVPVGAKGGFVVKGPVSPPAVLDAYRTFVGCLLDLTDDVDGDRIARPEGTVCHDEPDPYLVVAADKGTATFSDVANALAEERGFWLGDAFASGGSHGYDHKRMGITARGAWECVALHFRELDGRDVARDPFTVTGIGDMSGDVFGNGLLCSRAARLRAAFDHRHVFLDPDPDPEASYAERTRLFALPHSSWADYRPEALSAGGAVIPRGTKIVRLSAEARAMLGIAAETIDGDQLIQAVLRMPTDLLFNGGIGTYVKSRGESNADVGDGTNATVRVNASELRARVVGEGGNLGFTQRARVEFALAGGRINTDAIDNSAGVDTSDHEVNLKIALQPPVASGAMTTAERNALLQELAEDVAALVLAHNRSQSRAISRDQRRSETRLVHFREMMADLEATGLLDRALEGLPDRDALRARRSIARGLTRPELAVLLAYAKMHATRLLASDALCEDPHLERVLLAYFPARMVARCRDAIRVHRLRREIIATTLTNDVVDLMGAAFFTRTMRESGATAPDVARAFVVADALSDARAIAARAVDAGPTIETRILDLVVAGLDRAVRWILAAYPRLGPLDAMIDRTRPALAEAEAALPAAERARRDARVAALVAEQVPTDLAAACVRLEGLRALLDVAHVAGATNIPPATAAAAYFGAAEIFDFAWLRQALDDVAGEDRWERRAVESLGAELDHVRRELTRQLLAGSGEVAARVVTFRLRRAATLERIRALLADLQSAGTVTLPAIMVLVRELGRLEEAA